MNWFLQEIYAIKSMITKEETLVKPSNCHLEICANPTKRKKK